MFDDDGLCVVIEVEEERGVKSVKIVRLEECVCCIDEDEDRSVMLKVMDW